MNTFAYKDLKKKNYFEGWYQRITDENNNINYAFMFAITKDEHDPHAFIQVFNGVTNKSKYYRYETSDFYYLNDAVYIKDNFLSPKSMFVRIDDIEISVLFNESQKLKKHYMSNSSMSFLSRFLLECYQEVIVIDGTFSGEILIDGETQNINGKGYLEKTFGSKFPEKWIWIQGNHFNKDVSLTFAHGIIPFLKWKVKGFFTILIYNGKEYRFTSCNFSRMKIKKQLPEQIEIVIKKRRFKLIINAKLIKPVKLVGPSKNGVMNLDVFESINSLATLTFYKGRKIIFDTMGRSIGFENMYD